MLLVLATFHLSNNQCKNGYVDKCLLGKVYREKDPLRKIGVNGGGEERGANTNGFQELSRPNRLYNRLKKSIGGYAMLCPYAT